MTGRANTKLAWVVGAAVVWAWAGLYLAVGAPEGDPVFALGLQGGRGGVLLPGRLAELIEDESGVRIKLDARRRADGDEKEPAVPKLPAGISVEYLEAAERPMPPRIEVLIGRGPIRLPSRAMLVVTRSFLFKIDRAGVRVIEAPEGSPLRRKLGRMEEQRQRRPQMNERRDQRRGKMRERMDERREGGEGPAPGGERRGRPGGRGPDGPPPEGGHDEGEHPEGPPPEDGEHADSPPSPDEG
jgi:hypothetical protein